ncbi:uncharacterized protein LOC142500930 [Ascaphus truei]|uniref:uncharacterized protein LOC142500930 n=1 Tax=Ascaphus truei TaxID=8439 RepID=UPI003F5A5DAD
MKVLIVCSLIAIGLAHSLKGYHANVFSGQPQKAINSRSQTINLWSTEKKDASNGESFKKPSEQPSGVLNSPHKEPVLREKRDIPVFGFQSAQVQSVNAAASSSEENGESSSEEKQDDVSSSDEDGVSSSEEETHSPASSGPQRFTSAIVRAQPFIFQVGRGAHQRVSEGGNPLAPVAGGDSKNRFVFPDLVLELDQSEKGSKEEKQKRPRGSFRKRNRRHAKMY